MYGHGLPAPLPVIDARHANPPRSDIDHVRASQWKTFDRYLTYHPSLTATWNPLTGTPRSLYKRDGFLTTPSTDKPDVIVRAFLRANLALYRLSKADLAALAMSGHSVSKGSPRIRRLVKHSLTPVALDQR